MQVNSSNQMQNMNQMRMQLQNQNGGQKGKGMGEVMQSLSQDQREEVSQLLQSMPQEDRKDMVSQIKELDVNNLSQDQLYQSIMDILNPSTSQNVISSTEIDTYA